MSDDEIKKALEIIKNKAINIEIVNDIVDKKEYIGFDKDNFEILEQCYYNCQYFARNLEQLMINLKDKDKEIKRLNNIIDELEDTIYGKYHYFEDKLFKDAGERLLEKTYKGILDEIKELKENK